jgi:hypothetical protein
MADVQKTPAPVSTTEARIKALEDKFVAVVKGLRDRLDAIEAKHEKYGLQ